MTRLRRNLGTLEQLWNVPPPDALRAALAPDPDIEADFYAPDSTREAPEEQEAAGAEFEIYTDPGGKC